MKKDARPKIKMIAEFCDRVKSYADNGTQPENATGSAVGEPVTANITASNDASNQSVEIHKAYADVVALKYEQGCVFTAMCFLITAISVIEESVNDPKSWREILEKFLILDEKLAGDEYYFNCDLSAQEVETMTTPKGNLLYLNAYTSRL
jgi:hypothetical protein